MCLFNFFKEKERNRYLWSVIFHRNVFMAKDNVRCLITIKVCKSMYVKTVFFSWTRRAVGVNSVCIFCRRCSQTCLVLSKRQPWKYWTVVTICFQECPCLESSWSFIINNEDFCSPYSTLEITWYFVSWNGTSLADLMPQCLRGVI